MSRNPVALVRRNQVETLQFRAWFGESKVVGVDGLPLVVYHGTQSDFSYFSEEMSGSTVWSEDWGFFFTNDPAEANGYAELDWDKDDPRPNVMPVYLAIKNPKVVTLENDSSPYDNPAIWYDHEGRDAACLAQAHGCDGLMVVDMRDDFELPDGQRPTLFVAFSPVQIKSAIGNCGTFDANSKSILNSFSEAVLNMTQEGPNWSAECIALHDKWSLYLEKSAQLGDGFVRWVEDDACVYVTDIQCGQQSRGASMLVWLKQTSKKPLHAIGVVDDAANFWDLMQERGLISGQSDEHYLDYFSLRSPVDRGQ